VLKVYSLEHVTKYGGVYLVVTVLLLVGVMCAGAEIGCKKKVTSSAYQSSFKSRVSMIGSGTIAM